jgi:hypothetical protein
MLALIAWARYSKYFIFAGDGQLRGKGSAQLALGPLDPHRVCLAYLNIHPVRYGYWAQTNS